MVAGGGATNAGVQFQAAVAACALAALVTGPNENNWLSRLVDSSEIGSVHFETDHNVDDVVVKTNRLELRIQAKTTISLSRSEESIFVKTIGQMVADLRQSVADLRLALVVSPNCSGNIRVTLKKLCESVRDNQDALMVNPHTETEKSVIEAVRTALKASSSSKQSPTNSELTRFMRALYVVTFNHEANGSEVRMIQQSLSRASSPRAFWDALTLYSVGLATNRGSVDRQGIQRISGPHLLHSERALGERVPSSSPFSSNEIPMGYEFLLVEERNRRQGDAPRIRVIRQSRFNDAGQPLCNFHTDNTVEVLGSHQNRPMVRFRGGTLNALEKFLESDSFLLPNDAELVFDVKGAPDDLNKQPVAVARSKACVAYLSERWEKNLLRVCLVCGDHVSDGGGTIVEIDQDGRDYQAGFVHGNCRRPLHRVIGWDETPVGPKFGNLRNFDVVEWIKNLENTQYLWRNLDGNYPRSGIKIGWSPENRETTTGGWALEFVAADGRRAYHKVRGKVDRTDEETMKKFAKQYATWVQTLKNDDALSIGNSYIAPISDLYKAGERDPSPIVECNVVELSNQEAAANSCREYYAPLISLDPVPTPGDPERSKCRVLFTSPLRVREARQSAMRHKISWPEHLNCRVLQTDSEFDSYMYEMSRRQINVVVDPVWDLNGRLSSGLIIQENSANSDAGLVL